MLMFNNLIDGEWLSDGARSPNVNPSDTNDIVGEAVRGTRAQAEAGDRGRQGGIPGMVAIHAASALRHPEEGVGRDAGPQGRTRPVAVARGRQDAARRRRRSGARRTDLCVLRRRMPAHGGREACLGAPRHRHRDHARGARRRRPDHAVEFSDRDPGLEDRAGAGLRQYRGDQAGGARARLDLGAGRYPAPRRPAQGRAQPGDRAGSEVGAGLLEHPDVVAISFTGSVATGQQGRGGLRRLASDEEVSARDGRQEPAGRAGRCGPEGRGGMRRQQRVLFHRAALHRGLAADRHRRDPRQLRRGTDRADARPEGR